MNSTDKRKDSLPIIIHPSILEEIRAYFEDKQPDNAAETYYLYSWLYETSRFQGNNQVWANDVFLKKKLRIGGDKLKRAKAVLRKLDLIDYIRGRANDGSIIYYIHVRKVWGYDPIIELGENCHALKCKKELIETYGESSPICTTEDIELDEIFLDGEELWFEQAHIYFEKGLIKIRSFTGGGVRDFALPKNMANDIIRRAYNYTAENMF